MKNVLCLSLIVSFLSLNAFGASLKDIMEPIGDDAKIVAKALKRENVTTETLAASQRLSDNVALALEIYPDTAKTGEDKATYDQWMAELFEQSVFLEGEIEAIVGGDISRMDAANAAFKAMMDLRKKGHDLFKEDE